MHWRSGWQGLLLPCVIVALAAAAPSGAQIVVFNNFGAGNAYDINTGWTEDNTLVQGEQFIPSASGPLDTIELALSIVNGTNSAKVYLVTDSAGQPGSSVLESWTTTSMGPFNSNNPPLVFSSTLHPSLASGTPYWVYVDATGNSPGTWAAWNWNSVGGTGPHASSTNGGSTWSVATKTQGAFRVTVKSPGGAVPVPAAPVVTAIGAIVYGFTFFRKRSAA